MPAKQQQAITWWNPAVQTRPVLDSSSFAPALALPRRTCLRSASRFLAVRIFAALSQCLFSENPSLSIKLYCIYVCYTNVTLYAVLRKLGRSWNVLPVDMGALLYYKSIESLSALNSDSAEVCSGSAFTFALCQTDWERTCGEIKFCGFVPRPCGLVMWDRRIIRVMLCSGLCTRIEYLHKPCTSLAA
jgi:hypothetical protein